MAQTALNSRIMDSARVALAAENVDVWVFNKGAPMIVATSLGMTGGQDLETTDAASTAWFYYDPSLALNGMGLSQDVDRQTDVNNTFDNSVLTNGTVITGGSRRCTVNASWVSSFKEIENPGGSSFFNPNSRVSSGENSEGQVSISVQNVKDRDGRVVAFSMRTDIAVGGGAETPFLAKLRFPKPHAKPAIRFPMPVLRSRAIGASR
jgi:hypothetical protein